MLIVLLIITSTLFFAVLTVLFLIWRKISGKEDAGAASLVNQNISALRESLDSRLDKAAEAISGVNRELGSMQQLGRKMEELHEFLRSPKIRGGIGEEILKNMLEEHIPGEYFKMQHSFSSGEIVDAIIKTPQGVIPIDSKFPLESIRSAIKAKGEERKRFIHEFGKDVRKHVASISRKYILPSEGTVDFALMYVPSEQVYYEVIRHNDDLMKYARDKKIFFVSPNTFYYFIRAVWLSFQEQKIAEGAREIMASLQTIRQEASKFRDDLGVLDGHIDRAKKAMEGVRSHFIKLEGHIEKTNQIKGPEKEE